LTLDNVIYCVQSYKLTEALGKIFNFSFTNTLELYDEYTNLLSKLNDYGVNSRYKYRCSKIIYSL